MSRIGKQPIAIPAGVTITVDDHEVLIKGPKGELKQFIMSGINVQVESNNLLITRDTDERIHRSKHGLLRSLLNNMIIGVTKGFEKKLELNGVGYRVQLAGASLKLNLGFSHDVIYHIPEGIQIKVVQNIISVSGISKQLVGQVASEIRSLKKPEPYKGKGIQFVGERILRKSGKSGKE